MSGAVAIDLAKTFEVDFGVNLYAAVERIRRADSLELSIRG